MAVYVHPTADIEDKSFCDESAHSILIYNENNLFSQTTDRPTDERHNKQTDRQTTIVRILVKFFLKKTPIVARDVCPSVRHAVRGQSSMKIIYFRGNLISNKPN